MPEPVKVLIAFYSRNGSTAALAEAIAEGVRSEGAEAILRRVDEFVPDSVIASTPGWAENRARLKALYEPPTAADAASADAVVFGTPTRFGNVSAELKSFIDSLGGLWYTGALVGKVGSVFTSTGSPHGGNETTLVTMFIPLAHFGMVIVPPGYGDPAVFAAGSPYGATSISGANNEPPTEADLTVARYQGRRVAQVAAALKTAREAAK